MNPEGWRVARNECGSPLVGSAEAEMSNRQREIYHGENGDRWLLCHDDDGRVFVLHKANISSGGTATKIELGDFLGKRQSRSRASGACPVDRQSRRKGLTSELVKCEFG
jgi:hypothetical protein